ncbi:MAG: hypothetical protein ACJA0V_002868, partial [Planctomycetota bacterium]
VVVAGQLARDRGGKASMLRGRGSRSDASLREPCRRDSDKLPDTDAEPLRCKP